jgi:YgiT-type zinc finger domain-containing protein
MERCYFCKGRLTNKTITHIHTWGEKILLFEEVPAEVCQQCGETYFHPDVLEIMDQIAANNTEPKTTISIPVFSMSDAAQHEARL